LVDVEDQRYGDAEKVISGLDKWSKSISYIDAIKATIVLRVFVDPVVFHPLVDFTKTNFSNPHPLQEITIRENVQNVAFVRER
jgi:hypothetical protein